MSTNHPATEEVISQVVAEAKIENDSERESFIESELSSKLYFADEIKSLSDQLKQIQNVFKSSLQTIVSCIRTGKSDVEIVWESPDCYIVIDHEDIIKKGLEAELELVDEILEIHSRTAAKELQTYPGIEIEQGQPWMILKPEQWSKSEWTIDAYLTNLVSAGLSPTQILDYWMVEVRNKHLPQWASIRGTSTQAVRGNVNKANTTLNEYDGFDTYSPSEYFERTYQGVQYDDGSTLVTVDGGYLPPRRDVHPHSKTGRYTWGYKGAGPTQLAFAILSDALDKTTINHGKITSFRDYLNSLIGEDDQWRLGQNEVLMWNRKYESE